MVVWKYMEDAWSKRYSPLTTHNFAKIDKNSELLNGKWHVEQKALGSTWLSIDVIWLNFRLNLKVESLLLQEMYLFCILITFLYKNQ